MLKEKLDYKLVNLALIVFVVFIIHQTGNFWYGLFSIFLKLLMPLFIAFSIAYALNPITNWLEKKGLNKKLSVISVTIGFLVLVGVIFSIIFPMLFNQINGLLSGIIEFVKELADGFDLNFGPIEETIINNLSEIIKSVSNYLSDGAIRTLGMSFNFLTNSLIVFAIALYFLYDFNKIKKVIKKFLRNKNMKIYNFLRIIDKEFINYLSGLFKVMVIAYFEYTIVFLIIGHPQALLLGFLAAIANLIPYFGGLINNVLAVVTAFVISPALFARTIIASVILSAFDSFVINPFVYGKTNQIHPIVVIFAVYAGGLLFGPLGIFIALPTAILFISGYKYFKDDITEKLKKK